ncbi:MAG: DUF883 domain-containing protein [Methylococcales bacterium]|nr:DUF883 domain-containing protein [Methylococcales bacterium]
MNTTHTPGEADDETVARLRTGGHDFVDKIADATTHATDAISQKGEALKATEQKYEKNCRNYLHDNPISALGIAAGLGFLLSRLLGK